MRAWISVKFSDNGLDSKGGNRDRLLILTDITVNLAELCSDRLGGYVNYSHFTSLQNSSGRVFTLHSPISASQTNSPYAE